MPIIVRIARNYEGTVILGVETLCLFIVRMAYNWCKANLRI
jgi:hypothetical protein